MSDDITTSLDALPMESAGGAHNVKMEVKKKKDKKYYQQQIICLMAVVIL